MIRFIFGWFGYARVEKSAIELAYWIKMESAKDHPDFVRIHYAAERLEAWLRSCRSLS